MTRISGTKILNTKLHYRQLSSFRLSGAWSTSWMGQNRTAKGQKNYIRNSLQKLAQHVQSTHQQIACLLKQKVKQSLKYLKGI